MTEDSVTFVEAHDLDHMIGQETVTVIDVREPGEFATGHIADSINMPVSNFDLSMLIDLSDENEVDLVFVCAVGQRSFGAATAVLEHVDCKVFSLKGGLEGWSRAGLDLEDGQ